MRQPTVGGKTLIAVEKKIAAIDMIYTPLLDGSFWKLSFLVKIMQCLENILECNFTSELIFRRRDQQFLELQHIEFRK